MIRLPPATASSISRGHLSGGQVSGACWATFVSKRILMSGVVRRAFGSSRDRIQHSAGQPKPAKLRANASAKRCPWVGFTLVKHFKPSGGEVRSMVSADA